MNTVAFNTDMGASGTPPEWVQLLPAGPQVTGRDGRRWLFDAAASNAVLTTFNARATELPIDWEHASQHRAPNGEEAPAGGWIKELQVRAGALWGRVAWNARAAAQIAAREYRFLSPVFDFDPATGRIGRLVCAGLTNLPNLALAALNQQQDTDMGAYERHLHYRPRAGDVPGNVAHNPAYASNREGAATGGADAVDALAEPLFRKLREQFPDASADELSEYARKAVERYATTDAGQAEAARTATAANAEIERVAQGLRASLPHLTHQQARQHAANVVHKRNPR
ncbi:MAG: hypothetical protein GXC76_01880 [Rhodanobacteraceae bacterium]|jgi:phage I-like protein|nr:hypothetical protein [Rhodanobacteraceae bacterium]